MTEKPKTYVKTKSVHLELPLSYHRHITRMLERLKKRGITRKLFMTDYIRGLIARDIAHQKAIEEINEIDIQNARKEMKSAARIRDRLRPPNNTAQNRGI